MNAGAGDLLDEVEQRLAALGTNQLQDQAAQDYAAGASARKAMARTIQLQRLVQAGG